MLSLLSPPKRIDPIMEEVGIPSATPDWSLPLMPPTGDI